MEEFNGILPVEVHMTIDSSPMIDDAETLDESQEDDTAVNVVDKSSQSAPASAKNTSNTKRRRSKRNKPPPPESTEYERMECNLCLFETDDGREALQLHYTEEHSKEDLAVTLIDIIYPGEEPQESSKEKGSKRRASLYPCPVCTKSIAGKNNLEKHLIRHRSQKPFKCEECKKMFSAKRDLQLHEMRHHSKERPHVCPTCQKGFVDKAYLKKHMTFHDQSVTYVCEQCGKSFNNVLGLQKHCKTHSQERPYMCERCSKCFRVKYDLTVHKRNVHKEGSKEGGSSSTVSMKQQSEADSSSITV